MKPKLFIIVNIITLICLITLSNQKISAEEKVTITNKITEELIDGNTYTLNGMNYTYDETYKKLTGTTLTDPSQIKLLVIYHSLNNLTLSYSSGCDLTSYTALEDIVLFSTTNSTTFLKNIAFKNLYMANQNDMRINLESLEFESFHFVSPYKGTNTDIVEKTSALSTFENMNFTNAYYYNYNEVFFKTIANKYNALETKSHTFIKQNETTLNYTKESFYPFDNFTITHEQCGIKYHRGITGSTVTATMTNETMPYIAYEIDDRVVSATIPAIASTDILSSKTYDTLDLRQASNLALTAIHGETLIYSSNSSMFYPSQLNFKNIYLTLNSTNTSITYIDSVGNDTIEKIYIPEEKQEYFTGIINDSVLSTKVQYYQGEIKVDFTFTNTAKTKTYKSSDDYIDIDNTLEKIAKLETAGVTIPEDCYINEFLDSYIPPVEDTEEDIYTLSLVFIFTKNIDINKALELMKPYMLYKNGIQVNEEYEVNITIQDEEYLSFIGTYPNNKTFSYTCSYIIIESDVGEFFCSTTLEANNFTLFVEATTIKSGITAKDLMEKIITIIYDDIAEIKFNFPITLTKEGISEKETKTFKTEDGTEHIATGQVIVTNEDLNVAGYTNPYKTLKDEYGNAGLIEIIKDNPTLKRVSIGVSVLFGIILLYLLFLIIRKLYRWLKR